MLATAATLAALSLVLFGIAGGFVGGVAYTHWETKRRREASDNYQRLRTHQLDRLTIHGDGAAIISIRSVTQPYDQETA